MKYFGSAANGCSDFRLIPRIETYPKVVSFSQTSIGKSVILALFGLGLRLFIPISISVLVFASIFGLTTFLPEYRRFILAVCPITLVLLQTMHNPLLFGSILTVIILGLFLYWCVMGWPQLRFGKRPIALLFTGFNALILLAGAATRHSLTYLILWGLVVSMASYVWFIGYALLDRSSKPKRDLTLELASFRPLWGSTNTPFPKGAAYLRRIEAQNPEQLAITQLKGLKLLTWAILLAVFQILWYRFFHGYLQIPTSAQALAMSVRGTPVAWHLRWESQLLYFFESVLAISVTGHRFIAGCRLAGFNALRNTYRPLSSTTIAEFFNRFYYYYKELLVDFFFYPTFFRYWKGNRRLRMVFATFAAVVFGNTFYHFTRDWQSIMDEGLWNALAEYQVFIFYSAALAIALSVSQLRTRGGKPTGFVLGRLLPIISVGMFFCLLNIFGRSGPNYPLIAPLGYFASLFFIQF